MEVEHPRSKSETLNHQEKAKHVEEASKGEANTEKQTVRRKKSKAAKWIGLTDYYGAGFGEGSKEASGK